MTEPLIRGVYISRSIVRCSTWVRDMHTYKAILRDNQIEWLECPPETSGAMQVYITFPEEKDSEFSSKRGELMAEVLAELARRGTFADIPDPVAWQRELRAERALPDRDV